MIENATESAQFFITIYKPKTCVKKPIFNQLKV